MPAEQREKLNDITRLWERQDHHWKDFFVRNPGWQQGQRPQGTREEDRWRRNNVWTLGVEVLWRADRCPRQEEYVRGMPSWNWEYWDQLKPVPAAVASRKLHYLPRLQAAVRADASLPFSKEYPDCSPASGGSWLLIEEGWEKLLHEEKCTDAADYAKNVLQLQDGEARLLRSEWAPFETETHDGDDEVSPLHPRFWHHQFAMGWRTREQLRRDEAFATPGQRHHMPECEVLQILARDKETGALMLDCASGQWQIRQGNFITLSEAFWFGKELCSCYDIYRWYLTLPVWIQKRVHSMSTNPEGLERRVAKRNAARRPDTGACPSRAAGCGGEQ